jgi:ribose 5-phosphate isomerase A
VIGLGSGSTAALALQALGRRVRDGLRIIGIPTSEQTAAQARRCGIPLSTLEDEPRIDLTIDGADEVEEGTLHLIKGRGGALLREKIVATVSKRLVIVVHAQKLVTHLAEKSPLPVEVAPFGCGATARLIANLGGMPALRRDASGATYTTDSGHYILDCAFPPIASAESLANQLDHVVGVVEHGLFIGMAWQVHVAGAGGVRILTR